MYPSKLNFHTALSTYGGNHISYLITKYSFTGKKMGEKKDTSLSKDGDITTTMMQFSHTINRLILKAGIIWDLHKCCMQQPTTTMWVAHNLHDETSDEGKVHFNFQSVLKASVKLLSLHYQWRYELSYIFLFSQDWSSEYLGAPVFSFFCNKYITTLYSNTIHYIQKSLDNRKNRSYCLQIPESLAG